MARPWLKVEPAVLKHPKTRALAKLWGCHPYQVAGFLLALWGYCLEYQEDGKVADCPGDVLDELAAPCQGRALGPVHTVLEALQSVGFADADGYLHDWDEFTGGLLVQRRNERERKRLARRNVRRTSGAQAPGQSADGRGKSAPRVEQSRVEESREEPKSAAARAVTDELRTALPEPYRETLDGLLRSAGQPTAVAYSIRAMGPGGIHEQYSWDVIGRALFELAAANARFSPAVLAAFCRRLAAKPAAAAGAVELTPGERAGILAREEAERERQARGVVSA